MNRFSLVTAGLAFLLIIAGALVTSADAAGSISDWPLSFGALIPSGPFSTGVAYSYAHRVVAAISALFTFALFVWVLFGERRAWVKWVAALSVALIAAQGAVGGLRAQLGAVGAPAVAIVHAFFAQVFLGVIVSLTVFTSPGWVRAGKLRAGFAKAPKPLVFFITTAASVALLIQILLGAAYRQNLLGAAPHIIGAVVTGALVFWAAILVVRLDQERDRGFPYLTRPARAGLWLFVFQLAAGILTYLFWTRQTSSPQIQDRAVITSVFHSGLSAALVTTEVMLLIRLYRMVPIMEQPI